MSEPRSRKEGVEGELGSRMEAIIKQYEAEVNKWIEEFHRRLEEIRTGTLKEIEEMIKRLEEGSTTSK